ncbi:hypothetical protein ACHAWF_014543 [Thalassiosira exigua]
MQANAMQKALHWDDDDDEKSSPRKPQDRAAMEISFAPNPALRNCLTKRRLQQQREQQQKREESVYTNQESGAVSRSTGFSEYDEESEAIESAAILRSLGESVSTGYGEATFDDTATRSKSLSTGVSSGFMSNAMMSEVTQSQGSLQFDDIVERVLANDPTLKQSFGTRALTKLDMLCGMNVGICEDALSMFDAFSGNTHVRTVDLSMNELYDDCVSSLSLALLENNAITQLNLANNNISSDGAEYLYVLLESNGTLTDINDIAATLAERQGRSSILTDSVVSDNLEDTLERMVANDLNLTEVWLNGFDLSQTFETDAIFEALTSNTYVTSILLNATEMDDTLVAALSLALVDNSTVTRLSLRDNNIGSVGCEYVLGTLDSNQTITHVDLGGN